MFLLKKFFLLRFGKVMEKTIKLNQLNKNKSPLKTKFENPKHRKIEN